MLNNVFTGAEHQAFHRAGTNGAALLLIHGFPGTPAEMRPLAEVFHQQGWTAHGVLLPGFGADIATLADRRLADWQNALVAALTSLRRDHEVVWLAGNSMGGALAIHAAVTSPTQIQGLLLFNPFWEIDNPLWKLLPALRYVFPQIKPFSLVKMDFNDPSTRDGIHKFMPSANLDDPATQDGIRKFAIPTVIIEQIRRAGQLGAAGAGKVGVPVLVTQGNSDELVKPEKTRILAAKLHAQYEEVAGQHNILDPAGDSWARVHTTALAFAARYRAASQAKA